MDRVGTSADQNTGSGSGSSIQWNMTSKAYFNDVLLGCRIQAGAMERNPLFTCGFGRPKVRFLLHFRYHVLHPGDEIRDSHRGGESPGTLHSLLPQEVPPSNTRTG